MNLSEVSEGLKPESVIVVNSKESCRLKNRTYNYDATSLALDILGKDIVNTAMLGVFAKVTGIVSLDSLLKAMEEFPPKLADLNKKLVHEAFRRMEV